MVILAMSHSLLTSLTSLFLFITLSYASGIQNLDEMVSEYRDSYVILFSFDPKLETGPITRVPITIYGKRSNQSLLHALFHNVTEDEIAEKNFYLRFPSMEELNWKQGNQFHNFSFFILLPEKQFESGYDLGVVLRKINFTFPACSKVYINIFTSERRIDYHSHYMDNIILAESNGFSCIKFLSIYQVRKILKGRES